jgi:hypothetical protein
MCHSQGPKIVLQKASTEHACRSALSTYVHSAESLQTHMYSMAARRVFLTYDLPALRCTVPDSAGASLEPVAANVSKCREARVNHTNCRK